jgi:ankyrin repeat protein
MNEHQSRFAGHLVNESLHHFCKSGKLAKVLSLLQKGADPNALNDIGETPLKLASAKGHLEIVKVLLGLGSDVNYCPEHQINSYTETALCAAVRGQHLEVVSALIEAGARPQSPSSCLFQPLNQAARLGFAKIVEKLIQAGASLSLIDGFGETPLHSSVKSGCPAIIRLLLMAGADVNAIDSSGMAPLHIAVQSLNDEAPSVLFELLKWRPCLEIKSVGSLCTPAELAQMLEKTEALEILCCAGATPPSSIDNTDDISFEFIDARGNSHTLSLSVDGPRSEASDKNLAKTISDYETPGLLKNFGWTSSPRHWAILERLVDPTNLLRIAYFARNCCNAPKGCELDDAMCLLGESYQDAVNRFVESGLLRKISVIESVGRFTTIARLKQFAKQHSLKVAGTKEAMLAILLASVPESELEFLVEEPRYIRTELAKQELSNKKKYLVGAEKSIQKHMLGALTEGNLFCAGLLALDICTLRGKPREVSAQSIYKARITLSGKFPEEVKIGDNEEQTLRRIGAMNALCPDWNSWSGFGVIKPPTHPFAGKLTPYDFSDEIVAWNEHNEE